MIEFDPEFPSNATGYARQREIFSIIKTCFEDPDAYIVPTGLPNEYVQMQIAKEESLKAFKSNIAPYESKYDDDCADGGLISGIDSPKQKKHKDRAYSSKYELIPSPYDPYAYNQHYNKSKKPHPTQQTTIYKHGYTATTPMYESQLFSLVSLDAASFEFKDCALRQKYMAAMELKSAGDLELECANFKNALRQYSKMFVHLGMNGTRKLSEFCNQTGNENALKEVVMSNEYKAMDALRLSAYNQMAEVYKKQQRWHKVIEKCSKVTNI